MGILARFDAYHFNCSCCCITIIRDIYWGKLAIYCFCCQWRSIWCCWSILHFWRRLRKCTGYFTHKSLCMDLARNIQHAHICGWWCLQSYKKSWELFVYIAVQYSIHIQVTLRWFCDRCLQHRVHIYDNNNSRKFICWFIRCTILFWSCEKRYFRHFDVREEIYLTIL